MPLTARLARTAAALAALAAGFCTLTAMAAAENEAGKPSLTDADYAKLIAADSKVIKDALGGKADKKAIKKAKAAAMMLALYAQSGPGGDTDKAAALRDAAVSIFDSLKDGKADAAKKTADDLPAAKGPGKAGKLDLHKHEGWELADLMSQFGRSQSGGQDLEKNLLTYVKKAPAGDALAKAGDEMRKISAIGQYTELMEPAGLGGGQKTKANWLKWATEMKVSAAEAAAAAGGKGDFKKAAARVEKSCSDCHNVFRSE